MFKRLSTELALIYAALFGAVLLMIASAVFLAVETNSREAVRAEMTASSAVFDRLWKLRADQLGQSVDLNAVPLVVAGLVERALRGELTVFNPASPEFSAAFKILAASFSARG